MNISQWLYSKGRTAPQAPALFQGESLYATYRQYACAASAVGQYLRKEYSIQPGDRVALFARNRVEYLILMYATWWIGAVVVPVNSRLHPDELAWILGNADASLLCTDDGKLHEELSLPAGCQELGFDTDELQGLIAAAPDSMLPPLSIDAEELAWLFYTSGTTGRPKGVMLSHGNLTAMSLCYGVDVDDLSVDDAVVYAAPLSHGAGLYNFIHVRSGARHVIPTSRGFDSAELLSLARNLRNVTMFAAPTMVKRLVTQARRDGESGEGIKTIVCGGAPMYAADFADALDVLGPRIAQIYGQGETPMTITAIRREVIADRDHERWLARVSSVGTAQSCVEVRVVDKNMCDLPAGEAGQIIVRGSTVMAGYWKDSDATRETLIDGWLHTGDVGYFDNEGYLTLTDRLKDVIISGGSNIYPREVEEVLASHHDVYEVAVIGAPHEEWGEEVVAFIVPMVGTDIDVVKLDAWCKQHIAGYKRPRHYRVCQELPKNSYGKVLKTELRDLFKQSITTNQQY